MALFSFFGKKDRQPDNPGENENPLLDDPGRLSREQDELAAWREAEQLRAQRDIARITAEKIDAIESEIARDILKSPHAHALDSAAESKTPPPAESSTDPFQSTVIRPDIDGQTLLRDDFDD